MAASSRDRRRKPDPQRHSRRCVTDFRRAFNVRQLGADADGKLADVMKQKGIQVNVADAKSFVAVSKPVWKMITDSNKFKDAAALMEQISALGN